MRAASHSQTICGLLLLTLLAHTHPLTAQTATEPPPTYTFTVPVDEVILTFHATGPQGLPANDLKLNDLSLLDNGAPPHKILEFRLLQDFPIHAGILIDTSESMSTHLPGDRAIAIRFAQSLLRQQTDQAYLMDFGRLSRIQQPWTGNSPELVASLRRISTGTEATPPAQPSSTPSTEPASTSSAQSIPSPAATSSCSSPTAKTMPAPCSSKTPSICVNAPTPPSTPFAPSKNLAPAPQARKL